MISITGLTDCGAFQVGGGLACLRAGGARPH